MAFRPSSICSSTKLSARMSGCCTWKCSNPIGSHIFMVSQSWFRAKMGPPPFCLILLKRKYGIKWGYIRIIESKWWQ
jgi:hypothetical protein